MKKIIFIGDTHGFIDDFKKQKEIIENYKSESVLAEQLQEVSILNKGDYQNKIYLNRFSDQNKLINLCSQKGIKLVGIAFKDFGFSKRQQNIVKGEIKPTKQDIIKIQNLTKKRTKHHIILIKKYFKLSQKPIIVILGSWHLKENSELRKFFKSSKIIIPVDETNHTITKPKKINKIHYLEIGN